MKRVEIYKGIDIFVDPYTDKYVTVTPRDGDDPEIKTHDTINEARAYIDRDRDDDAGVMVFRRPF